MIQFVRWLMVWERNPGGGWIRKYGTSSLPLWRRLVNGARFAWVHVKRRSDRRGMMEHYRYSLSMRPLSR